MATKAKTEALTAQADNKVTFGTALSSFFSAIFHIFTAAERGAIVVEKTVQLAEAEVDNIHKHQQIRLASTQGELNEALAKL